MARPLGVRGHQKRSYLVASYKTQGEMFLESSNEHTTMLALDIDPRTQYLAPQPFTLRLDLEKVYSTKREAVKAEPRLRPKAVSDVPAEERVYTPDFLVTLANRTPLVVESKSSIEIARISTALARRGLVLNNLGFRYLVVSSTDVEHQGLHTNLVLMRDAMQFRSKNETQPIVDGLFKLVSNRLAPFALGEIRGQTTDLALYLSLIAGVIGCDLRGGRLGVNTMLWQAHGELAHLQLLNLEC